MAKFFRSKSILLKRYRRFSNICVYFRSFRTKRIRFGYKYYQKVFRRFRAKRHVYRINVRSPRLATRRKTFFGKALEFKEKLTYTIGGINSSKLQRYCHLSRAKLYSPQNKLTNFIECRLDISLFKSNLVFDPKLNKFLIQAGAVIVNKQIVDKPYYRLKPGDIVSVAMPLHFYRFLRRRYRERIRRRLLFVPSPSYMEVNYKTLQFTLLRRPLPREVFYPYSYSVGYFFRLYNK